MASNKNHEKEERLRADRFIARLALAGARSSAEADCPSNEDLAALVDGRLTSEERSAILVHLDQCRSCYRHWLALAAAVELEEEGAQPKVIPEQKARSRPRKKRALLRIGAALAMAAGVVLLLWYPAKHPGSLEPLVVDLYRIALDEKLPDEGSASSIPLLLPWEKSMSVYGFGGVKAASPASLAFGAGLWQGRAILSGNAASQAPPDFLLPPRSEGKQAGLEVYERGRYAPYFWLGRWCVLMEMACRSSGTARAQLWSRQKAIMNNMEGVFFSLAGTDAEARIVVATIQELYPLVARVEADDNGARACRAILDGLDLLMENLLAPL